MGADAPPPCTTSRHQRAQGTQSTRDPGGTPPKKKRGRPPKPRGEKVGGPVENMKVENRRRGGPVKTLSVEGGPVPKIKALRVDIINIGGPVRGPVQTSSLHQKPLQTSRIQEPDKSKDTSRGLKRKLPPPKDLGNDGRLGPDRRRQRTAGGVRARPPEPPTPQVPSRLGVTQPGRKLAPLQSGVPPAQAAVPHRRSLRLASIRAGMTPSDIDMALDPLSHWEPGRGQRKDKGRKGGKSMGGRSPRMNTECLCQSTFVTR